MSLFTLTRPRKSSDRRGGLRLPIDAKGELFLCPANSRVMPLHVHVKDVSETGVGVMYGAPLPLGQKYVVKQPSVAKTNKSTYLFTVVRSEPVGDGRFSIGLHASHLSQNDFVHAETRPSREATSRMAPMLIAALIVGVVLAMMFF